MFVRKSTFAAALAEKDGRIAALEKALRIRRKQVDAAETRVSDLQSRADRAELELDRLRSDYQQLILLTAGRVPPKLAPEFDRDPWREDPKQLVEYLTPDDDEAAMVLPNIHEAVTQDGSSEGRRQQAPVPDPGY